MEHLRELEKYVTKNSVKLKKGSKEEKHHRSHNRTHTSKGTQIVKKEVEGMLQNRSD